MRSSIRQINSVRCRRHSVRWLVVGSIMVAGGCTELINPFVDDLPATSEVSTASVAGVRQDDAAPVERVRGFAPAYASAQDGTVSHWPLWWEDPFVDKGSADHQFAWTWEDYVAFPYGLGRSLVNTMGWPVSATVTPPFTVMGSDGALSPQCLGYDHDATRLPGGLAPPIDILEVGTIPPGTPEAGLEEVPVETAEQAHPSE